MLSGKVALTEIFVCSPKIAQGTGSVSFKSLLSLFLVFSNGSNKYASVMISDNLHSTHQKLPEITTPIIILWYFDPFH